MIASALVSKRRRDCLHQTPIEAQSPQSGGAGPQARGPRNGSARVGATQGNQDLYFDWQVKDE